MSTRIAALRRIRIDCSGSDRAATVHIRLRDKGTNAEPADHTGGKATTQNSNPIFAMRLRVS